MIDPASYDTEHARMQAQVRNLAAKYADDNAKVLAVIPKADHLFKMRIQAGYDTPAEARAFVVRAIATQLSGKPATYEDVSDSRYFLGDQSYVPDSDGRDSESAASESHDGPTVITHPAWSMASALTAALSR